MARSHPALLRGRTQSASPSPRTVRFQEKATHENISPKNDPRSKQGCREYLLWMEDLREVGGAVLYSQACRDPQCRRPGVDPQAGKIPWKRAWLPTPLFLPWRIPWTEEPGGLQFMGSQRVRQDRATNIQTQACSATSVVSRSLGRCGLQPARLLCPWDLQARILDIML